MWHAYRPRLTRRLGGRPAHLPGGGSRGGRRLAPGASGPLGWGACGIGGAGVIFLVRGDELPMSTYEDLARRITKRESGE